MGDLFLHIPFARRLRLAEGLHPLASEALIRRPSLVALGASLSVLPGTERKGMSFFRRLFSGGGEAARWEKLLAPQAAPRLGLIAELFASSGPQSIGQLGRCALGFGLLAHDALEAELHPVLSGLDSGKRTAIERALARLWLQAAVPRQKDLDQEWRVAAELADLDAARRVIEHLERALRTSVGQATSRDTVGRWLKGLAAEISLTLEKPGLPPAKGNDDDARALFESAFLGAVARATSHFVTAANAVAALFTQGDVTAAAVQAALGGDALSKAPTPEGAKEAWAAWLSGAREAALERGRNPKPAFAEGESQPAAASPRPASFTAVMSISDLPPEAHAGGMRPGMPRPPAHTQEVSLADIEAEAGRQSGFAAPAHTQEVSVAQIEAEAGHGRGDGDSDGFAAPALTQEVSLAQIEAALPKPPPPPALTQEISLAQIEDAMPRMRPPPPPENTEAIPAARPRPPPPPEHTEAIPAARPSLPADASPHAPSTIPPGSLPPGTLPADASPHAPSTIPPPSPGNGTHVDEPPVAGQPPLPPRATPPRE